jgi:hypothetical protein
MNDPFGPDGLRTWARGSYPLEAATELLIRAFRGRFTEPGWPWVMSDDGCRWIDFDAIDDDTVGALSGGERRLLMIAGSLGSTENRAVNLSQVLPGLDRTNLALVVAAIAHAGDSHEHSDFPPDGRAVRLPSLAPWAAVATGSKTPESTRMRRALEPPGVGASLPTNRGI